MAHAARRSASKLSLPLLRKSATRAALGAAVSIPSDFGHPVAASCLSSIIPSPWTCSRSTALV
jgi:hypothetical protein